MTSDVLFTDNYSSSCLNVQNTTPIKLFPKEVHFKSQKLNSPLRDDQGRMFEKEKSLEKSLWSQKISSLQCEQNKKAHSVT